MGWVVEQHGALYAEEYGWNTEFEALVAEIVAGMIRAHDPAWEAGWIAERATPGGTERLGSAFVVRKAEGVAQQRQRDWRVPQGLVHSSSSQISLTRSCP